MNKQSKIGKVIAMCCIGMMLLTSVIAMMPSASAAPDETTSSLAPLPYVRHWAGVASVDDKLYVFGGWTVFNWGTPPPDTTLIYDVTTGETVRGANMPVGVLGAQCVRGSDGLIYVIGGWNVTYQLITQIYHPASDTWTSGAATPTEVGIGAATLGVDGNIYIFGNGWNTNITLIYNPVADQYSYGMDIPILCYGASAVTYNSTAIFLIGGYNAGALNDVQIYNPVADTWSTAGSLNTARCMAGAALARDGFIYVYGGVNGYWNVNPQLDSIERYDPSADSWTTLVDILPVMESGGGSCVDSHGRMFFVGGFSGAVITGDVQVIFAAEVRDIDIAITSPSDGATVSGEVSVTAEATGAWFWWGFAMIDLYIDSSQVVSMVASTSISYTWHTGGLVDGSAHVILVRAFGYNGSIIEDSITVTVRTQSVEDRITLLQQKLNDFETKMTTGLSETNNGLSETNNSLNAVNDQLDNLDSSLDQAINDARDAKDSANSANSMAMLSMLLALIVVILLLVNIIVTMRRKHV